MAAATVADLRLRTAEDHGGVDLALAARAERDPEVAGHAHDAPAAGAVDADDLQHVGAGAVERLALAGVGADREHPPGAAVTEAGGVHAERGPPAADDLPGRSDGEGDVAAGGDDRDGRALPRACRRRGRHRAGAAAARALRAAAALGGGRPAEVAPGIQPRHEGREGCRRPGDGDAGGVGATRPPMSRPAGADAADDVAAPEPASAVQAPSARATASGATSATAVERRAAGRGGKITGPR